MEGRRKRERRTVNPPNGLYQSGGFYYSPFQQGYQSPPHLGGDNQNEVKKMRTKKLEEGASNPHLSKKPQALWGKLLQAVRQKYGEAGLSALGSQECFAKVLNSKRNAKLPPIPRTVANLSNTKFPENYRTIATGGPFLILDTSKETPVPGLALLPVCSPLPSPLHSSPCAASSLPSTGQV